MSLYDHETKVAPTACSGGSQPEPRRESTVSFLTALLAMIEEYEIAGAV